MKLKNINIGNIILAVLSFVGAVIITGLVTEGVVYKSLQFFVLDDGSAWLIVWKVFVVLARLFVFGGLTILIIKSIYKWLGKGKEHTFHIGDEVIFGNEFSAKVFNIQPGKITMSDVVSLSKEHKVVLSAGDTILGIKSGEPDICLTVTSIEDNIITVEESNQFANKYLLVFNDKPKS